jgi:choline dehydrogenase-like flavoprotein
MSDPVQVGSAEQVLAALARGVLGEGYSTEVPGRMVQTLGRLPGEAERKQAFALMRALGTRAGALALTGRPVPVSWMSATEAEALVVKWKSSRTSLQRRLATIATALSLSALYGYPGPEWERIGYQGPIGKPSRRAAKLHPESIDEDEVVDCDVVIVGSGPGGGCVADYLARAGLEVVILEKGRYFGPQELHHLESQATRDMYLYGMTLATADQGCRIIAGSTLGGGGVVNYTTSFKTPPFVLEEWARLTGIDAFVSGEVEQSLDEMSARLNVNTDSSAAGRRDALMEEGLKKLGWHVDMLPRAVKGCTQDEQCGYCGFGCRVGAKTSPTLLETAAAAGARMIIGANVSKVIVLDGRAVGVEASCGDHRLTVKARAVVVAAGSIESPALLLRSGLRGQVGHNLHLHPGTAAWGVFDEDVRIWEGTLQARYSTELRDRDGGYGPIFETVPAHPGAGSTAAIPWVSAADHRERMNGYRNLSFCAVLPRDKTAGRVRIARDGSPRVVYKLQDDDERRLADGVVAAARVLEAAGARSIYSSHPSLISYTPGNQAAYDRWADDTRRAGYKKGAVTLFSYHQMSSCRMGSNPATSAIGPDNETHEVSSLYVTDSSAFPTATGVNPMLSIYGIAHRAAQKIAARLA